MQPLLSPSINQPLVVTFIIALFAHLIVLTNFNIPRYTSHQKTQTVAVTIVNQTSKKSPKKAHFLAQQHQVGTAKLPEKIMNAQQILPINQPHAINTTPQVFASNAATSTKSQKTQRIITGGHTNPKIQIQNIDNKQKHIKLSMHKLKQQLKALNNTLNTPHLNINQRIKPLKLVSTHQYAAAQYISDWKQKIERMGKLNYPNINSGKGFTNSLTMDVGINADGSIYSLYIRKSSGSKQLDDAAKRIVRLSAPFPPLPKALLEELDTLVITRIWNFTDNSH